MYQNDRTSPPPKGTESIIAEIDREIVRLRRLREAVSSAGELPGVCCMGMGSSRLLQLHLDKDADPKPVARAIGVGWVREGDKWRGVELEGFEVVIHGAEPNRPRPEVVVL